MRIAIDNPFHLVIDVAEDGDVRLLHLGATPIVESLLPEEKHRHAYRLVDVFCLGEVQQAPMGSFYTQGSPGEQLKYRAHRLVPGKIGQRLEVEQIHDGLVVTSCIEFADGIPAARCWTELRNEGARTWSLEHASSFAYYGVGTACRRPREQALRLHAARSGWSAEVQWTAATAAEWGVVRAGRDLPQFRHEIGGLGTWSSSDWMPMGVIENTDTGESLAWQVEHQGSWRAVVDLGNANGYLRLGGPNFTDHHFLIDLAPGATFTTVPVAIVAAVGGFDAAVGELTRYRRAIRRDCDDLRTLPVIFNDYMNCLWGNPTTAKLEPLIDAAAAVGCEYFCVDCGWYDEGPWWDGVGEWLPAMGRFPGGIEEPLKRIRDRGMIPGLWLELEVMGVKCAKAARVPDDWFFQRRGKRIVSRKRYQLDYRNPAVRAHADEVIDRVVRQYGVGYIKMDYNINAGVGTDLDADSAGAGLLAHQRAYLDWLDAVFARHPQLVIENCGAGGMRMDYALLSRHSIQSTTDQTCFKTMATMAAAFNSAVTPEQAAVWSYPIQNRDADEVVVNMVNAMLGRIHQSGHLAELPPDRLALVREGLAVYKSIRGDIPRSLPFWPVGPGHLGDSWVVHGLRNDQRTLLAVTRLESEARDFAIPVPHLAGRPATARILYPATTEGSSLWNAASGHLHVSLPKRNQACVIEIV